MMLCQTITENGLVLTRLAQMGNRGKEEATDYSTSPSPI